MYVQLKIIDVCLIESDTSYPFIVGIYSETDTMIVCQFKTMLKRSDKNETYNVIALKLRLVKRAYFDSTINIRLSDRLSMLRGLIK